MVGIMLVVVFTMSTFYFILLLDNCTKNQCIEKNMQKVVFSPVAQLVRAQVSLLLLLLLFLVISFPRSQRFNPHHCHCENNCCEVLFCDNVCLM